MTVLEKHLQLKPSQDFSSFLPGLTVRHAAVGLSGDLWLLATDGADTQACVLRHKGGAPLILPLSEPRGTPRFVAGLGKEETLTLSPDGQASVWDGRARLVKQFSISPGVTALQVQAPGIFVSQHGDGCVRQWSHDGTPLAVHRGPFQAVSCINPEELLLLGEGQALLMRRGEVHASFKVSGPATALAMGAGHLVTTALRGETPVITLWALGKQKAQPVITLLPHDVTGRPLHALVHGRGAYLVLADGPRIHQLTVTDLVDA